MPRQDRLERMKLEPSIEPAATSPRQPAGKATPLSARRRAVRWALRVLLAMGIITAFPLGYYLYVDLWNSNFHTVVPGQVYRSANPTAGELSDWHAKYGLKTVIDLREAQDNDSHQAQAVALGMTFANVKLLASHRPDGPTLRGLIELIEKSPRPILVHCHGGADRSGLASCIAAMAIGGQDFAHAQDQFSICYFHLQPNLPIRDVLREYVQYCQKNHLDTAGWQQFRDWAMNVYQ